MHFILPLDALHISDYISPSSGATFYKLYIAFGTFGICRYHTTGCCVAIGIRSPDRPTRSESLYRLSYHGHHIQTYTLGKLNFKTTRFALN